MKRIRLVLEIRDDKRKSLQQIPGDWEVVPEKLNMSTAAKHLFAPILEQLNKTYENQADTHVG